MGNVQFIRGTPRRSTLGGIVEALQSGVQGYQGAQDRKLAQQKESLASMKTLAEMQKLQKEASGLNAPVPSSDYFRDPASGKLYPNDPYRGRGTTVNLPFQFDAGQKDLNDANPDIPEGAVAVDDNGYFIDAYGNQLGRAE